MQRRNALLQALDFCKTTVLGVKLVRTWRQMWGARIRASNHIPVAWDVSMRFLLFVGVLSIILGAPAHSDPWKDAWGVVTDPLKVGKASTEFRQAIERAAILAERLEGKLNDDLKARINQIGRLARTTLKELDELADRQIDNLSSEAQTVIASAMAQVNSLEKRLFQDAHELVVCTVEISSHAIKETIAEVMNTIGEAAPEVVIFGTIPISEVKINHTHIPTPHQGYLEAQRISSEWFNTIARNTEGRAISRIYGEMMKLASETMCHYKNKSADNPIYLELIEDELEYARLARPWRALL